MKRTSEAILNLLKGEVVENKFNELIISNPNFTHGDVTVSESLEKYLLLKSDMQQFVSIDIWEQQPFSKRNGILTALQNLNANLGNVSSMAQNVEAIQEILLSFNFKYNDYTILELNGYKKTILKIKNDFNEYSKELTKIKDTVKTTVIEVNKAQSIKEESDNLKSQIHQILIDVEKERLNGIILLNESKENGSSIKNIEIEVQKQKINIDSFVEKIDNYCDEIETIKASASEIISKGPEINSLIDSAKVALNLKLAEGISAAFISKAEALKNNTNLKSWVIASVAFVIIALLVTGWIISGIWINDPKSISTIVGRIVAIGILISGATFCAKQYIKNQNLIEDYEYKAVLAKSIVAFSNEIKKQSESTVVEYLTKVLNEIHRDPLRERKSNNESEESSLMQLIEKATDKVSDKMTSKIYDRISTLVSSK